MKTNVENKESKTMDLEHPRCLSVLPSDIEELLKEFKKQGKYESIYSI